MAKLVEDDEIYAYLNIIPEDDDPHGVALHIRDSVEELLETTCSQHFGPSELVSEENQDGHGTNVIYTNREIEGLVDIKFRYGHTDENRYHTLDLVDNVTAKGRRIYSRHLTFPRGRDNILISYTAKANQPKIAKQAVREAVAVIFRKIGSEDARSEQLGTFGHVMLRGLDETMSWRKSVELLQIPTIG